MNLHIIIISILLTVICVLLALLQHFYIINLYLHKRSTRNEIPYFEDLIPPSSTKEVGLPAQKLDDDVLNDLTSFLYKQPKKIMDDNFCFVIPKTPKFSTLGSEIQNIIQAATAYKLAGKTERAKKLFDHAAAIAPDNADVLTKYGEFLEEIHQDFFTADELYFKALSYSPDHEGALTNHKRSAQIIEGLDYRLFKYIDSKTYILKNQIKLDTFKTMKKQAYYLHIYHTVGIEGNTMTVKQLRHLLETGDVVPGKSIVEHNEVLGLEKALQYIKILIHKDFVSINDILDVHKRVMGHVDPIESGVFRSEKVFVGGHVPPSHEQIPELMNSYVNWLNSEEAHSMHPVRYAALAHYKLVDIHPFIDGNGRTSRLIMNLILMKYGYPPVMILKEQREKYYDTLKTANMGDVRPFVRFIAQCTLQVLDMYITNTRHLSIDSHSQENRGIINFDTV